MILNMRPMSEAPEGVPILAGFDDDSWQVFTLRNPHRGDAIGFYLLSDVLAAVELLRRMTPEGFAFTGEFRMAQPGELFYSQRDIARALHPLPSVPVPILRKLPEPVKYRMEAEMKRRAPDVGDWVWSDGEWVEMCPGNWPAYAGSSAYLCARRVEVERG